MSTYLELFGQRQKESKQLLSLSQSATGQTLKKTKATFQGGKTIQNRTDNLYVVRYANKPCSGSIFGIQRLAIA